jgi:hypothetical protein
MCGKHPPAAEMEKIPILTVLPSKRRMKRMMICSQMTYRKRRAPVAMSEDEVRCPYLGVTTTLIPFADTDTTLGGIPRSLPIAIGGNAMVNGRLASNGYQPKTSLRDRPEMVVPALRRPGAPYATTETNGGNVRDGAGNLELVVEDDEDDDAGADTTNEAGGRGRDHALKILKARSKVPDEGMWRSLAT